LYPELCTSVASKKEEKEALLPPAESVMPNGYELIECNAGGVIQYSYPQTKARAFKELG